MKKFAGALSLELGVICLLVIALAISLFGVIKDSYYDEIISGHRINSNAALVMVENMYDDMCKIQHHDDENGITDGDARHICNGNGQTNVDFSSGGSFDFSPRNNRYGNSIVD